MSWQACIENAQVSDRQLSGRFWNNASGLHWMHSQFHAKIGSYQGPWPADFPFMPASTLLTMGDMMDVATSPNDPLFAFHHANADRMNMHWQHRISQADPGIVEQMFGFPANYSTWIRSWSHPQIRPDQIWKSAKEGCLLDDVISSKFPFDLGLFGGSSGTTLTHRELLSKTLPTNAQYTYDTLMP
eukprot:TRINITY_DN8309_c0_g1_i2.p1 TRINITY_DN8309_c0_g1~~TRINITY_DN8309_c0_g1_i2.p1  ORF type:complete len:186 (+),score=29.06 TRINITY_DN8309_c0_g1_i2:879-1436(+)